MAGVIWYLYWQLLGVGLSRIVFASRRQTVRLWLGSILGTAASMWMPVLFAFFFDFGLKAHALAAVSGLLCAAALWTSFRRRLPPANRESCAED